MLLSKTGSSKGKAFSSHIAYDKYGRVIAASEESFGKKYERKNVVYDPIGRVHSYEKSLTSSGKTTHIVIENVYDSWSGTLYQLKDKSSGKVLWELEELTVKGKVLKAKLGGTSIQNTYDANDFLSAVSHKVEGKPDILSIAYSFNAIKNELNSRNTSGAFNILERFVYDDNNRLINWTNPRTGELHHNVYDKQGRIIENDQLGKIKFENKDKVYQPTGMSLNEKGAELLKNNLIQKIEYNENNDPIFIDGVKGDVRFEYGLTAMRQMMTFGGEFLSENASQNETSHGKFTRFYSEDGSFEVTLDHQSGKEKHILYIGGNPYESEIIFVKDFKEEKGSYKFLHKDYLGSILAISDEEGNKLEQRHYDAWGNLTHLQIGNGEVITDPEQIAKAQLLLDRGYTSHEHLWEVGIIHMNGRLYDPLLRRFLNADENIQDLHNTQNYNKYGYVFNNPLMYNDPSGEFVFAIFAALPVFWGTVATAAVIGAGISAGMYLIQAAITGNFSLKGFGKAILMGAVTGAVSGGINHVFSVTSFWGTVGVGALTGGVNGGITALISGENFIESVFKGAVIGGTIAGISWGIKELFTSKTIVDRDMSYNDESIVTAEGNETSPLTTADAKKTWNENWKTAYESTENAKKAYLMPKGSIPENSGYTLDKKTGLFVKNDGSESWAFTRTTYNSSGEVINHKLYLSNKAFMSKEQLNYVFHHEFGHMVLNNNYKDSIINTIIKGNDLLLNTEAHKAIQYSGSKFLNLNGWSIKNIKGVYEGPFFGGYTPEPRYINKLKPLLIKIK